MTTPAYTNPQKTLHWLSALLIAIMAFTGLANVYEWLDESVIIGHQIAGQLLIVVLAIRMVARFRNSARRITNHARWEQFLSRGVHIALYICLIAFVVTGYVAASALRDNALLLPLNLGLARSDVGELLLETHYALKWVLGGLLLLHLSGVIKHSVIDRDDTLQSIIPSKREDLS